jgi:hypothetical protein
MAVNEAGRERAVALVTVVWLGYLAGLLLGRRRLNEGLRVILLGLAVLMSALVILLWVGLVAMPPRPRTHVIRVKGQGATATEGPTKTNKLRVIDLDAATVAMLRSHRTAPLPGFVIAQVAWSVGEHA